MRPYFSATLLLASTLALSSIPATLLAAPQNAAQADPAAPPEDNPAPAAAEKPADEKPAEEEKRAEEKPAAEKPAEEKPAAEKPADAEQPPLDPAKYPKLPKVGSANSGPIAGTPWRVHDIYRPRPSVVTPGEVDLNKGQGTTAPSDAIVLFDGTDLSAWAHLRGSDEMYRPRWKVENGYMEVVGGTGSLHTIDTFGSCQLHIEWASPAPARGSSQGRGNSGIKLFGLYEVQVLDSFNNFTYADGQAGAIYGQFPPEVNAARQPGQWQTYDILFRAPEFAEGKLQRPAILTVLHNGVMIHHARELKGVARAGRSPVYSSHPPAGHIMLQDHGNPVRYRNIWIRPL